MATLQGTLRVNIQINLYIGLLTLAELSDSTSCHNGGGGGGGPNSILQ